MTKKENANSDLFTAVSTIFDYIVFNGVPVATAINSISQGCVTLRDQLLVRKLEALFRDLEYDEHRVHFSIAIKKLKEDCGEDYFREMLFHTIDQLDSSKMAEILGKAVHAFGRNRISLENFWSISYALKNITYNDIKTIQLCEKVKAFQLEGKTSLQRLSSVGIVIYLGGYGRG
ncbi:MAG: hypothetical protein AAF603_11765, partial [Pseudomonadota bacterium]